MSAQEAELQALITSCTLVEGQRANILSDSSLMTPVSTRTRLYHGDASILSSSLLRTIIGTIPLQMPLFKPSFLNGTVTWMKRLMFTKRNISKYMAWNLLGVG
ncbi:hypothetical protein XELAEV_18044332mg [Xenopus laevis]|uniref:Uncharacterized protein n=1 Tax=Xenopus laevis TaxID=8355 RepID=A0A974BYM2_XENLA|nr:hypothetical protein XELAEV_18044332mg [Xenopus laevis]